MSAQDLILGARVAHVRELQTALAQEKAANAALRDENAALKAHFDFALLAAEDLKGLQPGERLELWDGWNLVLGAQKEARDRADLVAQAKTRLAADAGLRVWIVFDGPREAATNDGRLRVSYTGGQGEHRADRFILAYVRMAAYLGLADRLAVRTNDKDFARDARRMQLTNA
jgi:hypothetical protein